MGQINAMLRIIVAERDTIPELATEANVRQALEPDFNPALGLDFRSFTNAFAQDRQYCVLLALPTADLAPDIAGYAALFGALARRCFELMGWRELIISLDWPPDLPPAQSIVLRMSFTFPEIQRRDQHPTSNA